MASIYDVVTAKFTASRWITDERDREPYLLSAFFTERKQLGIELEYLKGKKPAVRPLDLSAFDVKVLPLERPAFEKITTEMPFFKNSLPINEKMRQELLKVIATGNQLYIDAVIDKIYDDNKTLLEDASVTKEVMRAQLMTSGTINFASNGQAVSYDFGIPTNQKISLSTNKWTDATNSDPIGDIQTWQELVQNATGTKPTNILMNTFTFNLMKKSNSIKTAIYLTPYTASNANMPTPNNNRVKQFVLEETGCTIYVYDKGYIDKDSKEFTKFVSDYIVVLFPDGAMGEFVYGTTPEEADLMSGTDAQVQIVDGGVALTTYKTPDSVNVTTKVSMIALPTLQRPDEMVIATVGSAS